MEMKLLQTSETDGLLAAGRITLLNIMFLEVFYLIQQ
jgi:hypothetical protein